MQRLAALVLSALLSAAPAAAAPDHAAIARRALDEHILPGFERLAVATHALETTVDAACAGEGPIPRDTVDAAWNAAFDAWMGVAHLRFGPSEEENAAFAIAFWPDAKGATPRVLAGMVAAEDPVVDDPAAFHRASIAARGLFAMEQLLFDPKAAPIEAGTYPCRLLSAIAGDLSLTSDGILARWRDPWAGILTSAGAADNPLYFSGEESSREIYGALNSGLQATVDLRLGRPLGTFDKPQPRRAEAWRSGRSLENVAQSLRATRALAEAAFVPDLTPEAAASLMRSFDAALEATEIGLPLPEAVAEPATRVRVESLQRAVREVQTRVSEKIGGTLGITSGFNAMDGD